MIEIKRIKRYKIRVFMICLESGAELGENRDYHQQSQEYYDAKKEIQTLNAHSLRHIRSEAGSLLGAVPIYFIEEVINDAKETD